MMKRTILPLLFLLLMGAVPAWASSCYSRAEAEAEQGLRIHSELMVIGLNCQKMRFRDGTNLYGEYSKFTRNNIDIFAGYEDKLLAYYTKRGDANPEATLNTLRTVLANNISNSAARMKPDQFCNRYAGRIFQVAAMDPAALRKWASTIYPSHPLSEPICEH